jgi:hypothetical protein
MIGLSQKIARYIIEVVGSAGIPPEWGFHFFSTGLEGYLKILESQYLKTFIKQGGASFKIVIGAYGGGKTHFLYTIRDLAWHHNFIVSYCPLSYEESPFYRLEKVYRVIVQNLMPPLCPEELLKGSEKGIEAFLKILLQEASETLSGSEEAILDYIENSVRGIESINFARAIRSAVEALIKNKEKDFKDLSQWLKVEGYDRHVHGRFGILHPIDRGQALLSIRSLIQWIYNLRYSGLIILFDEAEQIPSLTSRQRELMLSNLRELIDECSYTSFRNVMIFYAIPTEAFFEGRAAVYEALKQRIASVFDFFNPTGVKIRLDKLEQDPATLLAEIGEKLFRIYTTAYQASIPQDRIQMAVHLVARKAYEQRFGDIGYKRLFVQGIIRAFHLLMHDPNIEPNESWALDIISTGS